MTKEHDTLAKRQELIDVLVMGVLSLLDEEPLSKTQAVGRVKSQATRFFLDENGYIDPTLYREYIGKLAITRLDDWHIKKIILRLWANWQLGLLRRETSEALIAELNHIEIDIFDDIDEIISQGFETMLNVTTRECPSFLSPTFWLVMHKSIINDVADLLLNYLDDENMNDYEQNYAKKRMRASVHQEMEERREQMKAEVDIHISKCCNNDHLRDHLVSKKSIKIIVEEFTKNLPETFTPQQRRYFQKQIRRNIRRAMWELSSLELIHRLIKD